MPRVLLTGFCAVPGPRRAGVQLRHAIRSLTPMHALDLLVVREGEQAYVERQGSVRVLRVPTHDADQRSQVQAFQRALKRQLDGADYDIVHCRDGWSGIPALEARSRYGYAVVYDLARSPLGETTFDTELDAQYARDEETCLLAADLVLAPTPAAVKSLQGRGKPERVMLSPPGVDVDRFDWEDPPRTGPPRILYAGAIDRSRGVPLLVRAMTTVVSEVDARLILAGPVDARYQQALRDSIDQLGLFGKVELIGPVDHDQLPSLYATATVCVVPAASDLTPNPAALFPTKILEYMASKRAIVAPRRETLAHVVEHDREALLFDPGDPVDLARKILRVIGEPAVRARLAEQAYERVRRDFTASAARRALRDAYGVLTARFSDRFEPVAKPEPPKLEMLPDDDFEPTVFEERPAAPMADSGFDKLGELDDALASLDESTGSREPFPGGPASERDVTMERAPLPTPHADHDDEWVVTNVGAAVHADTEVRAASKDSEDEAKPVAPKPFDSGFVAGEIDVPADPGTGSVVIDFTAASSILGQPESPDPDTGSRTPPLERR